MPYGVFARAENSRPQRIGRALILFALALAPIALGWIIKVSAKRPFWVHYYDPETIYFYDGMRIANGFSPAHGDNPATPVQVVSAAIVTVTGRTPERYESFLAVGHTLSIVMIAFGMLVLLTTIAKPLPSLLQACVLWTYFLAPQALERDGIWSPEAFYFLFGTIALATLWRALDGGTRRELAIAGLAIGLCIATKYVFLGWLPAFAFALLFGERPLLRKLGDAGIGAAAVIVGFLIVVSPAWSRMIKSFSWLGQLAMHSGPYGVGSKELPSLAASASAIAATLATSKSWLIWMVVVAALVIFAAVKTTALRGSLGKLTFSIAASTSSYVLASRDPQFRYLLPSALAVLFAFVVAVRALPRLGLSLQLPVILVAATLLVKNIREDIAIERRLTSEGIGLHAILHSVIPVVSEDGTPPIVLFSWRVPEASFALRFFAEDQVNLRIVSKLYPREGHYQPWLRQVYLPVGVGTWDYLVINAIDLPGFPLPHGLPIARVGTFLIVPRRSA